MSNNFRTAVSYGLMFHQQIRRKKVEAFGLNWNWKNYLPGPISYEDAELIMGIAGCWCYDPTGKNVKFYTNQNHPKWSYR